MIKHYLTSWGVETAGVPSDSDLAYLDQRVTKMRGPVTLDVIEGHRAELRRQAARRRAVARSAPAAQVQSGRLLAGGSSCGCRTASSGQHWPCQQHAGVGREVRRAAGASGLLHG